MCCYNNSGSIKLLTKSNFLSLGVLLNPHHQTDLASLVTAPNHSVLNCKFSLSLTSKDDTCVLLHKVETSN